MGARFLHSSDWQLGMTRASWPRESQDRYADSQIDAVRKLAQIAKERNCDFVVVAGDVFDSIRPTRRVRNRAVDALASFSMPIYLLPGNHDYASPATLWSDQDLIDALPEQVNVVLTTDPLPVPGVDAEVAGAPWPSRKPGADLLSGALKGLDQPDPGVVRVAIGHGSVDCLSPDPLDPDLISAAEIERSIDDRRVAYVALGDRHSVTRIADAAWYSGAPLATDYGEVDPGKALVVDASPSGVAVEPVEVSTWVFLSQTKDITGAGSVEELAAFLDGLDNKDRTAVKLAFVGTINLSTNALLDEVLSRSRDIFAALEVSQRRSELVVIPDDGDLGAMELSGFARSALEEIAAKAGGTSDEAQVATDALMLLRRLIARPS